MRKTIGSVALAIAALTTMVDQTMSKPKCDMIAIAEQAIVKLFPTYDLKEFKQVISESGNFWELTYELPRTMLGGVPIITIDKRTCKVVRAIHTQ